MITKARDDGYRGLWFTLGQFDEYGDKYSGGFATYTAKHVPLAVYAPQVRKTFFVYGGAKGGERHLLAMASYYDHEKHHLPRPTVVHDKGGVDDPHDNPSLALDEFGHLWVFVSGRGRSRPGYKYRSVAPYTTGAFEQVTEEEMTYPQPWWLQGKGFLHLFTKYTGVRELYWNCSSDGRKWTAHQKLAGMGGHYQVSNQREGHVITAFNMHPEGNVDRRTNLYFAQTSDLGDTWTTAGGEKLSTPLTKKQCPALVRDFESEGRLVYVKDIGWDRQGKPAILVVTSGGYKAGPESGPRWWTVCHWNGTAWDFHQVTSSSHNYDMGSIYLEAEDEWRLIGPTQPGPFPVATGGEMALWASQDQGRNWSRLHNITQGSARNHAYARRPVNAHPEFYAFWADGNSDAFSKSHLYFTNRDGNKVWRMPYEMRSDHAEPEPYSRGLYPWMP